MRIKRDYIHIIDSLNQILLVAYTKNYIDKIVVQANNGMN